MKLGSLEQGRDGALVVVSRDLSRYLSAEEIAPTLQTALDNWSDCEPALRDLAAELEVTSAGLKFHQSLCSSPLPRAYQWADGSAYVNHVELVRRARGATVPDSYYVDPLMYQGGSDSFLSPRQAIEGMNPEWGIDFEAEIAVITDDVPMSIDVDSAAAHIKLVMLVNDVSLRNLIPPELAKGFGFFHAKPSCAFSPVAVTPDELGSTWRDSRVHLPLLSYLNDEPFGIPDAGVDMTFNFAQLITHAARSRRLCAGTIIGSGTVSNKLDGGPGQPISAGGVGYSCIAELRTVEKLQSGSASTPFLGPRDRVRIEMHDTEQRSIFGSIEQTII